MRSFLTMLGIIIGIASIISIVSTIKGTNEQIKQNLIGAGNNVVRVQLYHDDADYLFNATNDGIPQGVPQVSEKQYKQIQEFDHVQAAAVYNRRQYTNGSFYYGNQMINSSEVLGVDNDYFTTCCYEVDRGRFFVPADFDQYRPVCVLDKTPPSSFSKTKTPLGRPLSTKALPW